MIKLNILILLLLPALSRGLTPIPCMAELCNPGYKHDAAECGCYFFFNYNGENSARYRSTCSTVCPIEYGNKAEAWLGSCLTVFPGATIGDVLHTEDQQTSLLMILNAIADQCDVGETASGSRRILNRKKTLDATKRTMRLSLISSGYCSLCDLIYTSINKDPSAMCEC